MDFDCSGCTSLNFNEPLVMPEYKGILICDKSMKEKIKSNAEMATGDSVSKKISGIHDQRTSFKGNEIYDLNTAFEEWLRDNCVDGKKLEINYNKSVLGVSIKGKLEFDEKTKFVNGMIPGRILSPLDGDLILNLKEDTRMDSNLRGFPETVNGDVVINNAPFNRIEFKENILVDIKGNFTLSNCSKLMSITKASPKFVGKDYTIENCKNICTDNITAETQVSGAFKYYNNVENNLTFNKTLKIHCSRVELKGYDKIKPQEQNALISYLTRTNTFVDNENSTTEEIVENVYYVKYDSIDKNSSSIIFKIPDKKEDAQFKVKRDGKVYKITLLWNNDPNNPDDINDLKKCKIYNDSQEDCKKLISHCFDCSGDDYEECLDNPPLQCKGAIVTMVKENGEQIFKFDYNDEDDKGSLSLKQNKTQKNNNQTSQNKAQSNYKSDVTKDTYKVAAYIAGNIRIAYEVISSDKKDLESFIAKKIGTSNEFEIEGFCTNIAAISDFYDGPGTNFTTPKELVVKEKPIITMDGEITYNNIKRPRFKIKKKGKYELSSNNKKWINADIKSAHRITYIEKPAENENEAIIKIYKDDNDNYHASITKYGKSMLVSSDQHEREDTALKLQKFFKIENKPDDFEGKDIKEIKISKEASIEESSLSPDIFTLENNGEGKIKLENA